MGRNARVRASTHGAVQKCHSFNARVVDGLEESHQSKFRHSNGGETGITVLDFDGLEGRALFEQWQADGLILPDMLTAQTGGGGVHVVIQHVPGLKATVRTLPGLDIKNEGGQIVTAPSLHRSGNLWRVEELAWTGTPGPGRLAGKIE
jgi:hypothetical protein